MFTDLTEDELASYRSAQTEPDDFGAFWAATLAESRAAGGSLTVSPAPGLQAIEVFDVTFPGFGGHPIRGWLRRPRGAVGPLPAVVEYVGYGGGRGHAFENLFWAATGLVHFQMDTRGQGSAWSRGDTGDPAESGPHAPGFMTKGIESPGAYYYRRLITDAVRAVDAVRTCEMVDPSRVAVLGGSQGGGLALAVAGLVPDVAALVAYAPFLCDFPRATTITDEDPYREIARYLSIHRHATGRVLGTLSYFDGTNFARHAAAPAWFSAALMDPICPPSTVYGAFHNYAGPKTMTLWPYNGHEAGAIDDHMIALGALRAVFGLG